MLPLTNHSCDFVAVVDVFLIPIGTGWAAEHLVGVYVPILEALDPVDAAIVSAECFVDVASLIVVIVHVRVGFPEAISSGSRKESFNDIRTHVVEIVVVVVEDAASIIGVHDLASGFGASIFVEKWAEGCCSGNWDDCLEM